MEFKALRVPTLTEGVMAGLEDLLTNLPGIEQFTISLETQELHFTFDEDQLSFRFLAQEMEKIGCPLRGMSVALFF
jgi:hypothetical protein